MSQDNPPSLPRLITEYYLKQLSVNHPLTAPRYWAENILVQGKALVMFDGFDEVPPSSRPLVSQWLSNQMREYGQSVFILTSRPAGYQHYTAQTPTIPLWVNKFTAAQQEEFIYKWYLCQEKCYRAEKQLRQAQKVAKQQSDHLIAALRERRDDLGYMAENPLLLNMLVTFHRFDPGKVLPRQRLSLYRNICKLQLDDRPRARGISMVLSFEASNALLQHLALRMVKNHRFKITREELHKFLLNQPIILQEGLDPSDWIQNMLSVSELLVEREPNEYEFSHASFQGFFAATQLAKVQYSGAIYDENTYLILKNWFSATWRETILLYVAQLPLKIMEPLLVKACKQRPEAVGLAIECIKEYPRADKLDREIHNKLQRLAQLTQKLKYRKLEHLLKAGKWREADQETRRLMVETVSKEEQQNLQSDDLRQFPCSDLQAIDQYWVTYSNSKWGFSVQKEIWQNCGAPKQYNRHWEKLGDRLGWRRQGKWLHYGDFDPKTSCRGELPRLPYGGIYVRLSYGKVAALMEAMDACKL
ncbi:MAG: hypothetical protein F6K30_26060 [Cyanothece sp. SIO2G6]|nr:hypothetical protein [Cyanothece sp. SIO2G6]